MKHIIEEKIRAAVRMCFLSDNDIVSQIENSLRVVCNKNSDRGHYSCNVALVASKSTKENSLLVARRILRFLGKIDDIKSIELAGSGFMNFFICENKLYSVIDQVFRKGRYFGESSENTGKRVHIEYVSANPTGPLHVGHGRSAAYGSCISNLLKATGFEVHREYYINDFGRQINILALSVWLRYLALDSNTEFPDSGLYQGRYINSIAKKIFGRYNRTFYFKSTKLEKQVSKLSCSNHKEKLLDSLISEMTLLIGENTNLFTVYSLNNILLQINKDLTKLGVCYDNWFYESTLADSDIIKKNMRTLEKNKLVYKLDGATWFKSSNFGDSKDRVLCRSNGEQTYFSMDSLYHTKKYEGKYDLIINIFGSDHHGYVKRIESFVKGIGQDQKKIKSILLQFAVLYRKGKVVSMSTRSGEFITIRSLISEIGKDATRFFYITRKPDQHLEFDIDLAKSNESKNPVYYIQYAYTRASSIKRKLNQEKKDFDYKLGMENIKRLDGSIEKSILYDIFRYPEIVSDAARKHSPSILSSFLQEISASFHNYYNTTKIITSNKIDRSARMCLVHSVQQVITNGLSLLGISSPESM